jgi:hypothetical protein
MDKDVLVQRLIQALQAKPTNWQFIKDNLFSFDGALVSDVCAGILFNACLTPEHGLAVARFCIYLSSYVEQQLQKHPAGEGSNEVN